MLPISKLVATVKAWSARNELEHETRWHCPHQPIGSCSIECEMDVLEERW